LHFLLFRNARYVGDSPEAVPTPEQMAQFCQVLGIDRQRYPRILHLVAFLVTQGRELFRDRGELEGFGVVGPEWDLGPNFAAVATQEDEVEDEASLAHVVQRLEAGGSFFTTLRGNVGLGPGMLSPGDKLVRFIGLLTPCAVRSVPETEDYRLISGCYLYDQVDLAYGPYVWLSLV
jgi:hypothetical protein